MKIKCDYCGNLNYCESLSCHGCGAPVDGRPTYEEWQGGQSHNLDLFEEVMREQLQLSGGESQ